MVEMELSRILIAETRDGQIIVLKEKSGSRSFPIVIGYFEAAAIDRHVKEIRTPRPLTHDLLRAVNTALDGGGISGAVRDGLAQAIAEVDAALGVVPTVAPAAADGDAEVASLVEERTAARAARDFARADAIRARLAELGVVIEDTPHGTVWHRRKP